MTFWWPCWGSDCRHKSVQITRCHWASSADFVSSDHFFTVRYPVKGTNAATRFVLDCSNDFCHLILTSNSRLGVYVSFVTCGCSHPDPLPTCLFSHLHFIYFTLPGLFRASGWFVLLTPEQNPSVVSVRCGFPMDVKDAATADRVFCDSSSNFLMLELKML